MLLHLLLKDKRLKTKDKMVKKHLMIVQLYGKDVF